MSKVHRSHKRERKVAIQGAGYLFRVKAVSERVKRHREQKTGTYVGWIYHRFFCGGRVFFQGGIAFFGDEGICLWWKAIIQ